MSVERQDLPDRVPFRLEWDAPTFGEFGEFLKALSHVVREPGPPYMHTFQPPTLVWSHAAEDWVSPPPLPPYTVVRIHSEDSPGTEVLLSRLTADAVVAAMLELDPAPTYRYPAPEQPQEPRETVCRRTPLGLWVHRVGCSGEHAVSWSNVRRMLGEPGTSTVLGA